MSSDAGADGIALPARGADEWELLPAATDNRASSTWSDATVVTNGPESDRYWRLVMSAPEIAATTRCGQFVMLTPVRGLEVWPVLPRPMAVYDVDRAAGTITVLYGVVGPGTRHMSTFRPGETMTTVGPLGRPFDVPAGRPRLLLLGRGIGVCSLTLLAGEGVASGGTVIALTSGRDSASVLGGDVFERYAARVLRVRDADGSSDPQRVTRSLTQTMDDGPPDLIATCGSRRLDQVARSLGERWDCDVQVSVEAHMACGLGYCHGCAAGYRSAERESPLVCKDGPVFRYVRRHDEPVNGGTG